MTSPNPQKKPDPAIVAYGIYGAVGFQLAGMVVGGLVVGGWADKKWGTNPWLTLTGLILGCIAGFYNLIRILTWKETRKN